MQIRESHEGIPSPLTAKLNSRDSPATRTLLNIDRISRRTALAIVLAAITITVSAFAAQDTVNYFAFYNALSQVKMNVASFSYTPQNYYADAKVNFTIENPTGYHGLALQFFEPNYSVNASGTTTPANSLIIPQQTKSLEPGKIVKIAFPFTSTWNKTWTNAQYTFTVNISLSTFLDPAAAVSALYLCQSNGGPGTCDQLAVNIEALGPSASRGGGA